MLTYINIYIHKYRCMYIYMYIRKYLTHIYIYIYIYIYMDTLLKGHCTIVEVTQVGAPARAPGCSCVCAW